MVKIIGRYKILVGGIVGCALAIALIFSLKQPTEYKASLLVYVKRKVEAPSDKFYSYDGYYATLASQNYADTVIGFLKSSDILRRGAEIAPIIPTDADELNKLSKDVSVSKFAPQLIKVSVTSADKVEARDIVIALAQATQDRIRLLNQTGDPYLSIDLVESQPQILTQKPLIALNSAIGLMAGLTVGIFAAAIVDYLKSQTVKERE